VIKHLRLFFHNVYQFACGFSCTVYLVFGTQPFYKTIVKIERAEVLKSNRIAAHHSVGLKVTEERLQLISERTGKEASVAVIDKYDEDKLPAGTKVIVRLPLVKKSD
jgi:hypothetical protein